MKLLNSKLIIHIFMPMHMLQDRHPRDVLIGD
jgi:hypothetical protein